MNGFIVIDKPSGFTSFDVVAKLRGILKTRKIGHTGTLDPMATGALVCMVGRATKLIQFLPTGDKTYRAKIKFGIATDTLDITGNITNTSAKKITLQDIENILPQFTGNITQIPPMFSAIKVDGSRLYDIARQGIELARKPRKITINSIEIIAFENQVLTLNVTCSAGTYIRSLADDLGKSLKTFATLQSLRRTSANGVNITQATTFEELSQAENPQNFINNINELLQDYQKIAITAPQALRVQNGGHLDLARLTCDECDDNALVRLYNNEKFVALGKINLAAEVVKPVCQIEVKPSENIQ